MEGIGKVKQLHYNPLVRVGVIPQMMFQSDRVAQLRALTAFYRPDKRMDLIETVDINFSDSYIPVPDLTNLIDMLSCSHKESLAEHIRRCFLFFFKNTTYVDNGPEYVIVYNGTSISVRTSVVKSFFYWQVYNDLTMAVEVERDDMNGSVRSPTLIAARNSSNDGQMKILVDAVLTVDAVECKEDLKILIVGSSHDPMIHPRSSYEPLFYMVRNSTIDMYDFLEESGESIENTNKVRRFRKPYDYSTLMDYDIYIDDAWYQGTTPFESRVYNSKTRALPANFSVKVFEDLTTYNLYHQVSYTKAGEKRMVSRSVLPCFKENRRLGNCPFCIELKFFLSSSYGDDFYKSIHRQHKTSSCIPSKWYQEISSLQKLKNKFHPSWVKLLSSEYSVSENSLEIYGETAPLRIPPYSRLKGLNYVELKEVHLREVAIVLDDDRQCVQVLKFARAIYFYDGANLYQHVSSQSIPTMQVLSFVKTQSDSIRQELQDAAGKAKVRQLMSSSAQVPAVMDFELPPQEASISRYKQKRAVYREKVNNLLDQ
jgi:hypothetical protein